MWNVFLLACNHSDADFFQFFWNGLAKLSVGELSGNHRAQSKVPIFWQGVCYSVVRVIHKKDNFWDFMFAENLHFLGQNVVFWPNSFLQTVENQILYV